MSEIWKAENAGTRPNDHEVEGAHVVGRRGKLNSNLSLLTFLVCNDIF